MKDIEEQLQELDEARDKWEIEYWEYVLKRESILNSIYKRIDWILFDNE